MNTTASRRFYLKLDQVRKDLKEMAAYLDSYDFGHIQEGVGELYKLLPEVKDEVRERIMKRATAMYCHALKVPYSEEMRRQLGQESVVTCQLDGEHEPMTHLEQANASEFGPLEGVAKSPYTGEEQRYTTPPARRHVKDWDEHRQVYIMDDDSEMTEAVFRAHVSTFARAQR